MKRDRKLLGGGADLTGRMVAYQGRVWRIAGKNHIGRWIAVRVEIVNGRRVLIRANIFRKALSPSHPHYARLIGLPLRQVVGDAWRQSMAIVLIVLGLAMLACAGAYLVVHVARFYR